MSKRAASTEEADEGGLRRTLMRSIAIAFVIFAVVLAGIAISGWMMDGERDLPFEYDGFD